MDGIHGVFRQIVFSNLQIPKTWRKTTLAGTLRRPSPDDVTDEGVEYILWIKKLIFMASGWQIPMGNAFFSKVILTFAATIV